MSHAQGVHLNYAAKLSSEWGPLLNTTLYSTVAATDNYRYLKYMLISAKHLFLLHSQKSAVPGVDRNDVHAERIAFTPSASLQQAIVEHLTAAENRIDNLLKLLRAQVGLLAERKGALISAAVTGKIDVTSAGQPS